MDLTRDIHSLTDFKRDTNRFAQQLKETGEPVVLTVNGRAEFVVQDAASYQILLEKVAQAEAHESLRRGLDQMQRGEGRPAAEVFAEIEAKFAKGNG